MLWIMVLVGESVISVCYASWNQTHLDVRVCAEIAVVICFCIAFLFFNAQPTEPEEFALNQTLSHAFCYEWLVRTLSGSILLFGSALKCVLLAIPREAAVHRRLGGGAGGPTLIVSLRLLAYSYGVSTFCIILIRDTHRQSHRVLKNTFWRAICRMVLLVVGIVLWVVLEALNIHGSAVLTVTCIAIHAFLLMLVDFEALYQRSEHAKAEYLEMKASKNAAPANVIGDGDPEAVDDLKNGSGSPKSDVLGSLPSGKQRKHHIYPTNMLSEKQLSAHLDALKSQKAARDEQI